MKKIYCVLTTHCCLNYRFYFVTVLSLLADSVWRPFVMDYSEMNNWIFWIIWTYSTLTFLFNILTRRSIFMLGKFHFLFKFTFRDSIFDRQFDSCKPLEWRRNSWVGLYGRKLVPPTKFLHFWSRRKLKRGSLGALYCIERWRVTATEWEVERPSRLKVNLLEETIWMKKKRNAIAKKDVLGIMRNVV